MCRRARRDQAFARADLLRGGNLGVLRVGLGHLGHLRRCARMADGADHFADPDHLALRQPAVKLLQHGPCGLARLLRPAQRDHIAVDHGLDAEPVFEHCEIGVIVSKEIAHEPDVVRTPPGSSRPLADEGARSSDAARPRVNGGLRPLALPVTRPPELVRAIQTPI